MKKQILIIIGILVSTLILLSISFNSVSAKYVLEENIMVATIKIDRTTPNVEVNYSPNEKTTEKVEVTLKADEPIQEPGNGWVLQEDGCTLKKEYEENTKEEVEVKDKSGNTKTVIVEVTNIDKIAPTVQIQSIHNSNTAYPNYANQEAEIVVNIIVQDDQKIKRTLKENDIQTFVNNIKITPSKKSMEIVKNTETEQQLKFTLSGIKEEGNLSIGIESGIVQDEAGNSNKAVQKDTQIEIDNTKPQVIYSQKEIEDRKIEVSITANEKIRELEGWNIENNTILKKVFCNELTYNKKIQDLAGNSNSVNINITGATNIIIGYASYNSKVGWSIAYGNGKVVGLEAVKKNPKYKTESVAFSVFEDLYADLKDDYLQGRAYIYTHWKEGSQAICQYSKRIYSYGWNPNDTDWTYRNRNNRVALADERDYFQLGGVDMNKEEQTSMGIIAFQNKLQVNFVTVFLHFN